MYKMDVLAPLNEEAFWNAFPLDLQSAHGRVLIQSPFISDRRVRLLSRHFSNLINSGVTICTFIQSPRNWNKDNSISSEERKQFDETKRLLDVLKSKGVHVTLRTGIHEKLAVIDESIMWEGSLNILSHRNTKERMRRWLSIPEVKRAISQHRLDQCATCLDNHVQFGIGKGISARPASDVLLTPALTRHISNYRAFRKVSQRELSDLTGIDQGEISRIEKGERNITTETLLEISIALEIEPILIPKYLIPSVTALLARARLTNKSRFDRKMSAADRN